MLTKKRIRRNKSFKVGDHVRIRSKNDIKQEFKYMRLGSTLLEPNIHYWTVVLDRVFNIEFRSDMTFMCHKKAVITKIIEHRKNDHTIMEYVLKFDDEEIDKKYRDKKHIASTFNYLKNSFYRYRIIYRHEEPPELDHYCITEGMLIKENQYIKLKEIIEEEKKKKEKENILSW